MIRKAIGLAILQILVLGNLIWAQDPGLPDSIIFGNLDGSPIEAFINSSVIVPVWVKVDDTLEFIHVPLASENGVINSRSGGLTFSPLETWDDVAFLSPDLNSPASGFTSQSLWAFADMGIGDPPTRIAMNYSWKKIAEFRMHVSADTSISGDTTQLIAGYNPINEDLIFGLADGLTSFIPAAIYGKIYFVNNCDAPLVVSTYPRTNQTSVRISADISVAFNVAMDNSTIDSTSFLVNARSTGLHRGFITYNGASRTVTFNPTAHFALGEMVDVVLTSGIRDSCGLPLDSSYSWTFTTLTLLGSGSFDSTYFAANDSGVYDVISADFNGDAYLDMATANTYAGNISILLNNGSGGFLPKSDYNVGTEPRGLFAADFNGDGHIDLATANSGSRDISVLLNNGNGTFPPIPSGSYSNQGSSWGIFCADFDGDGAIDIATTTGDSGRVTVFKNRGDGTFPPTPSGSYSSSGSSWGIFAADFNNDHCPDLAVTSGGLTSVKTFINNGDGTFPPVPSGSYSSSGSSWGIFCADFNGDRFIDLAITNPDLGTLAILLNNGDGIFPPVPSGSYSSGGSAWGIFCSDLDGDGDIDAAVSNGDSNSVAVLFNDGEGAFSIPPDGIFLLPGGAWGITCADYNGDGSLDIANANTDSNGVTILWNTSTCNYTLGDINSNGSVIASDVTYGVRYLKGIGTPPPDSCTNDSIGTLNHYLYVAADVNASCTFAASDITRLVSYFKGISALQNCRFFPALSLRESHHNLFGPPKD